MLKTKYLVNAIKTSLYVLVVGIPFAFYRYVMFPANLPKMFIFQVGIEFMAACWLALLVLDFKRFRPRFTPVSGALVLFMASLGLSAYFGADPLRSFWSIIDREFGVFSYLHLAALVIILQVMGRELNWRRVWLASVFSAALVSLVGIGQYFGLKLTTDLIFAQSTRPGSFFANASFMSAYLLFNFFAGAWIIFRSKLAWERWPVALSLLLMAGAIFAAQSIADILGLGFGLGLLSLFFVFGSGRRARKWGLLILGGLILFTLCVFLTRNVGVWDKVPGFSRIAHFSFGQSDVRDRMIVWRAAITGFKEKPLLGWGWDNFNIPFDRHYDPNILFVNFGSTFWDKPHNIILEYMVVGGVVGLAAYLLLLGALVYEFFYIWRKSGFERGHWAVFLFAGFAAYMLQNLTVFDTIGTYLMLALLLGLADSQYSVIRRPEAVGKEVSWPQATKWIVAVAAIAVVSPLFYLNWKIADAAGSYYWGIDYFLLNKPVESDAAWQKATSAKGPYREYAEKDFASVFQQALQQGVNFPNTLARSKDAIKGMEDVIALHPLNYFYTLTFSDLYNNLYSRGLGGPEYLDAADKWAEKTMELSPRRQQTYYVTARTKVLRGNPAGALDDFRKAVALNPDAADPHFYYGILLLNNGDPKLGKSEIEKARLGGRNPENATEAMNIGILLGDKLGDYAGAAYYLEDAVSLAHKVDTAINRHLASEAQLRLAISYYFANNYPKAKTAFEDFFKTESFYSLSAGTRDGLSPVLKELGVTVPQ